MDDQEIVIKISNELGIDSDKVLNNWGTYSDESSNIIGFGCGKQEIQELRKGVFDNLKYLSDIDFSDTKLSSIPDELFDNLEKLTVIDLSSNNLLELPLHIFDRLVNLQILSLDANQINSLDADIFVNQKELTHLFLYYNQLEELSKGLFSNMINLQSLSLYKNNLKKLDIAIFDNLINLQDLYLVDNELDNLPKDIFINLINLKNFSLTITDNKVPEINWEQFDNFYLKTVGFTLLYNSSDSYGLGVTDEEYNKLKEMKLVFTEKNEALKYLNEFIS